MNLVDELFAITVVKGRSTESADRPRMPVTDKLGELANESFPMCHPHSGVLAFTKHIIGDGGARE